MRTVPLTYKGKKAPFTDTLYGSGVRWQQSGDTQAVPLQAAIKLARHPEFEDARDDQKLPLKALLLSAEDEPRDEKAEIEREQKELEETLEEPPLANVEAMTKAQIVQYVHVNFGVELPSSMKKNEMVDAARNHMMRRQA